MLEFNILLRGRMPEDWILFFAFSRLIWCLESLSGRFLVLPRRSRYWPRPPAKLTTDVSCFEALDELVFMVPSDFIGIFYHPNEAI